MRYSEIRTCVFALWCGVPALGWSQTTPSPQEPPRAFPGLGQPNPQAAPPVNPGNAGNGAAATPSQIPNPAAVPNPPPANPTQAAPGQVNPNQVNPGQVPTNQPLAPAPSGQVPSGQVPGGQAIPPQTGPGLNLGANPTSASFPSPLPKIDRERLPGWFMAPGVREQLALNDQQFTMLQQAYGAMQLQLETSALTAGSGSNPNPSQVFSLALDKTISDPLKRIRYDQLHWQYLGVEALLDPRIQAKLGLTDEQRLQFANLAKDWNQDLATLRALYVKEPGLASQQFLKTRMKYQQNIFALLESPQRLAWQQLLGDRYEYDASIYLAPGGGTVPISTREPGGASGSMREARERSAAASQPAATEAASRPDPRDNIGRNTGQRPRPTSGSSQGQPVVGEGGEGLENRSKPPSNPGALAPLVP